MTLTTSTKLSLCGVVTITAAEMSIVCASVSWISPVPGGMSGGMMMIWRYDGMVALALVLVLVLVLVLALEELVIVMKMKKIIMMVYFADIFQIVILTYY